MATATIEKWLDEQFRTYRGKSIMVQTNRHVNAIAEDFIYREIPVLDKGYIKLIDYMGIDETPVGAARISYGKGLRLEDTVGNKRLINYLMSHQHTTPFEQIELVFECKMPIFVAREWVRHRTASINEFSARYAQLPNEVYDPENSRIKGQDLANKQGSAGEVIDEIKQRFQTTHKAITSQAFTIYEKNISDGIAKELSRIDLPLSTYTVWIWKIDMHNLLKFLKLRMAENAQWEIRQYANAIGSLVKQCYPMIWNAFETHVVNRITFSSDEKAFIMKLLDYALDGIEDTKEKSTVVDDPMFKAVYSKLTA